MTPEEEADDYFKTFDNSAEALSLLTRSSIYSNGVTPYYDLVITDHRMPSSGTEQGESLDRKKTRVIIVQVGRTRLHEGV